MESLHQVARAHQEYPPAIDPLVNRGTLEKDVDELVSLGGTQPRGICWILTKIANVFAWFCDKIVSFLCLEWCCGEESEEISSSKNASEKLSTSSQMTKESELQNRIQLKDQFLQLRCEFIRKRDAETVEGKPSFKQWWSEKYATLSPNIIERLLKQDAMSVAIGELIKEWEEQKLQFSLQETEKFNALDAAFLKQHQMVVVAGNIKPSTELIRRRIEEKFPDPQWRKPCEEFVRDLKGTRDFDPLAQNGIQEHFDWIIKELEKEIRAETPQEVCEKDSAAIAKLIEEFQTHQKAEGFKQWWKREFNSLDSRLRDMILSEDIKRRVVARYEPPLFVIDLKDDGESDPKKAIIEYLQNVQAQLT